MPCVVVLWRILFIRPSWGLSMESGYTFVHNLYLLAEWSKVCGAVKVAGTCASFEPLQAPVAISMALKKHYLCVCQLLDNLLHLRLIVPVYAQRQCGAERQIVPSRAARLPHPAILGPSGGACSDAGHATILLPSSFLYPDLDISFRHGSM